MEWQSEEDYQAEKKQAVEHLEPVVARLYHDTNNLFALSEVLRDFADHVEETLDRVAQQAIEQQVSVALDSKFNRKVSE